MLAGVRQGHTVAKLPCSLFCGMECSYYSSCTQRRQSVIRKVSLNHCIVLLLKEINGDEEQGRKLVLNIFFFVIFIMSTFNAFSNLEMSQEKSLGTV